MSLKNDLSFFNKNANFISKIIIIFASIIASCDSPDRLRPNIPRGLPVGSTLYYNTNWFECAVAVYHLDIKFMEQVHQRGISVLNSATLKVWHSTPAFPSGDDIPRWTADLVESLDCIEDRKLNAIFSRIANTNAGYFQVQDTNSVTLIAPDDGLVMVGGYE